MMTERRYCQYLLRVITYNLEDCVSQAVCSWSSQGQHVGEAKEGNNYHLPLQCIEDQVSRILDFRIQEL